MEKARPHHRITLLPDRSSNQLGSRAELKPDIDSRRQAKVVFANAKEIGVYVIALQAHRQSVNQSVVESAAYCGGERIVGIPKRIYVSGAYQELGKGRESAHRN